MDAKKNKVRGIRFEADLWDVIVREAKKAQHTQLDKCVIYYFRNCSVMDCSKAAHG